MSKLGFAFLMLLLVAGCATHAVTSGRVVVRDDRPGAEVRFSEHDRALLYGHYRSAAKTQKTPSGLAQHERLPPGLAKRQPLPAGLQGRLLPRELEAQLTALPPTHVRLLVGRDVVLMHRDSRILLDILYGVVPD